MKTFSLTHIILLIVTFSLLAITMLLASKLKRRGQNIMFFIGVSCCSCGIFFRYGMGLSIEGGVNLAILLRELLQVCSFNFILLPLMLFPKCEVARQFSIFFSMFAASTTLFSVSKVYANMHWYDLSFLNSWVNHFFAIAVPLWMLAARRLKPQTKYIPHVAIGVFSYFTVVAIISTILIKNGIITVDKSYSFIFDTMGFAPLDILYKMIPYPYFYLYPLFPCMLIFFFVFSKLFTKYKVVKQNI